MSFIKKIYGHYQYKKYLKYKSWNNTWALNALYKSFYLDYKKAEDKTDWRECPSKLLRLM